MPQQLEHDLYQFFLGSKINETGKNIILYWSSGEEFIIHPGDRIWLPKQIEAYEAAKDPKTEILFMGGALGGSKSHAGRAIVAMRLLELSKFRGQGIVPDQPIKGAIFSENYPVLKGRHIDSIKSWPSWLGKYYAADKEFRFHDDFGGPILRCLNLDQPEKYASDQYAIAFIDESTFNTEPTVNAVDSRVRWPGLSALLMLASNPGRIGHSYTKKRFVDAKTRQPGAVFIPSLLKDNPFLNLDDKYRRKLDRLPPKLKKAWLDGSWDQFEGQFFPDLSEDVHFKPPFRIPGEWLRFRIIDHGFKHPTACLWGAVDPKGNLYIYRTFESVETTADVNKRLIDELSVDPYTGVKETYAATFGDPALKRVDGSALGNKTPWEVYNDNKDGIGSFNIVEAGRDRIEGWQALQQAFHYEFDSELSEKTGDTVYKTYPRIIIFNTNTHTAHQGFKGIHSGNALWEELNGLVYDDTKVEDAAKSKGYYDVGEGDDSAECLRYLWAMVGVTDLSHVEQYRNKELLPMQSEEFLTDEFTKRKARLLAGTFL